jgi:diaminopimelate decarboxylase
MTAPGTEWAGVALARVLPALRRLEPGARACWVTDLDGIAARAVRTRAAFAPLAAEVALALKANALPPVLAAVRAAGLHADAGSLGELGMAARAGFAADARTLSGNGRTPEEAAWAAREGVACVSADSVGELELLAAAATAEGRTLRVALRLNPGIDIGGHAHVATGHEGAKFGIAAAEALAVWSAAARWPALRLDGLHLHIGSQLGDPEPLLAAAREAVAVVDAAAARGTRLRWLNLGGGFGHDYSGRAPEFPLAAHAAALAPLGQDRDLEWRLEPGRWLCAPFGLLLAEVLQVKHRADAGVTRRFVVLAAGMNDLIRPALYGAQHRIEPLQPRPGEWTPATVVGPVCESGDTFLTGVPLPPLERGDVVAIRDTGAYGSVMSSQYNGRGRLAEVVVEGGRMRRVRAGETLADLVRRDEDTPLPLA